MRIKYPIIFILLIIWSCNTQTGQNSSEGGNVSFADSVFNKKLWNESDGRDYPFREQMLNDVLYNDTIRSLKKTEILELLGEPDRINENHFYYTIRTKRLDFFILSKKSMVVKFLNDSTIDWIKIHG